MSGLTPFLLLAALALTGTGLDIDVAAAKNRPVSKVITLLKDMLKQLEKEAADDEEVYNKLACWCAENDKEKTAAVRDAEARIAQLTTRSHTLTAASSRLTTEIGGLNKEKVQDVNSLDEATGLRSKQHTEFQGEERDLLASIEALKAAMIVLKKHQGASLLQLPRSHMLGIATTIQHELEKHASLLQGVLTPKDKHLALSFAQAQEEFTQPTFKQTYAPQSGEIFGILKQMLEAFESNLSVAQKEELANHRAFGEVADAKNVEITTETDQADTKTGQRANTNEKNAVTKEDISDIRRSLGADEEFLQMLKEKCLQTDQEWEERQRTRQLEMQAVSKALAVLSGDDAHDLFTRTFNPSYLQRESESHSREREQASKLLSDEAKRLNKPLLATLAYKVRLDAFAKVKKAIDEMMAQLQKEKEDEIKHKDFCNDEFSKNQLETEKKERTKEDLTAKIEDMKMTITELADGIASLKSQIKEMQVQMKRAGEDREQENKDFQQTVADQRETQKLLKAALGILEDFYGKSLPTMLIQQPRSPAPAGFDAYKKSASSGGVLGLLNQIISDAKNMENDAVRAEEDAQKTYEEFVKDTNKSIRTKGDEIVDKSENKASTQSDLVTTKEAKESATLELEQLSNYNAELHQSCDFVLKNFDVRQTARDEEVEALKQAKAILSGSKFQAFLQRH